MIKYKNPIIKGFNPDPSICRIKDDYYLVTSTFEFFPGVPIYHSKDLINWRLISYCLTDNIQLPLEGAKASGGIYAPTIRYHKNLFYMTTTNVSNGGNFYVTTEDIGGKWSAPIWVDLGGIDPTIFFDDDGKVYFMTNAGCRVSGKAGIVLAEMDIITGKLLTEAKWISRGIGGRCCESPHMYKVDGVYYLMVAEGGTEEGHMVTIHRSNSLYGPFESCPHNPVLSHRNDHQLPIQSTGHADLIWDENGNCWMVCLGIRTINEKHLHNLGRETFLTPVVWEQGWPIVGRQGRIDLDMEGPLTEGTLQTEESLSEHFHNNQHHMEWNWVRSKDADAYIIKDEQLHLINQGNDLSSCDQSPCFMGIRQKEFDMCFEASVVPTKDCFGGITAYYNDSYHYDVFIRQSNEKLSVGIRKKIHDIDVIVSEVTIKNSGIIKLKITTDREFYHFYYCDENGNEMLLGKGMTAGLCTEGTHMMTFTGTYLGLFSDKGEIIVENVRCI